MCVSLPLKMMKLFRLKGVEFINEMPNSVIRNAVLFVDHWKVINAESKYFLWLSSYRINGLNLRLCHMCLLIFKSIAAEWKAKFTNRCEHSHHCVKVSKLSNFYQSSRTWCQNNYMHVLISLKDQYDCNKDIHCK